jgi:hypothetical protein
MERMWASWPVLEAGFFGGEKAAFMDLDNRFVQIMIKLQPGT